MSLSSEQRSRKRYAAGRTWEIVLDAVRSFDRPVSAAEVRAHLAKTLPEFNLSNVGPDLSALTVNSESRGNFSVNRQPRRCDEGNIFDRLIRRGHRASTRYSLYDPQVHGIWELADTGGAVLQPRLLNTADQVEIETARNEAPPLKFPDTEADARKRSLAVIVQREGQPAFRRTLLEAYDRTCAVTACTIEPLLEAAHIMPYRGPHTNDVSNGLLLRADLHKLFDLHLLCIDPDQRSVRLAPQLRNSDYAHLEGVRLRAPAKPSDAPLAEALIHHQGHCGWLYATEDGLAPPD